MSPPNRVGWHIILPCVSIRPSDCPSQNLVNATPPTVLAVSFWNCAGDFYNVWRCAWRFAAILRLLLATFFRSLDLVIFGLKAFRHWVSCECNSSYSLSRIISELCRCFYQGLKMCMTFCCNPQINFFSLIHSSDIIILVLRAFWHWVSYERESFYSFSQIFFKLYKIFLCHGLKMCMTFCCNLQINSCHFFRSSDIVSFGLKALRHWVSCECNSSYSFSQIVLKLCRCFLSRSENVYDVLP